MSELLAPSHLVESGEDAADEAEAYTEVDNIDPAAYYKVTQEAAQPAQLMHCSSHALAMHGRQQRVDRWNAGN